MRALRFGPTTVLAAMAACFAYPAAGATAYYDAAYRATIHPQAGRIAVELSLWGEQLPSRIQMRIDPQRYENFRSTDPLTVGATHLTWRPQGKTSRLRYEFIVDHQRSPKRYDSLLTKSWTVFRGDKLVPRAKVTARRNLHSRATLEFALPDGWSVIASYVQAGENRYEFDDPRRRFDRPAGWMLAGKIGVRREKIGPVRAIVAAPEGDSARRQDMLAFVNWNLPTMLQAFGELPARILIVTAGDPMWRGGLSGPASIFLHSDRPLISENRTSTLLHELVHVAMGIHADEESDWLVEGLAEFYSIETLRRSGGIGERRYELAMEDLARWARRSGPLFAGRSSGARTARAVITLRSVDTEIRALTNGKASLDDVARRLVAERGTVSLARVQKIAADVAGRPLRSLQREQLMKPLDVARAR